MKDDVLQSAVWWAKQGATVIRLKTFKKFRDGEQKGQKDPLYDGKEPLQPGWQNLPYRSPEEVAKEFSSGDWNLGVVGGKPRFGIEGEPVLVPIDFDDEETYKRFATKFKDLIEKTRVEHTPGNNLPRLFFWCDKSPGNITLPDGGGSIRGGESNTVVAPSWNPKPDVQKPWTVISDQKPLEVDSLDEVVEFLCPGRAQIIDDAGVPDGRAGETATPEDDNAEQRIIDLRIRRTKGGRSGKPRNTGPEKGSEPYRLRAEEIHRLVEYRQGILPHRRHFAVFHFFLARRRALRIKYKDEADCFERAQMEAEQEAWELSQRFKPPRALGDFRDDINVEDRHRLPARLTVCRDLGVTLEECQELGLWHIAVPEHRAPIEREREKTIESRKNKYESRRIFVDLCISQGLSNKEIIKQRGDKEPRVTSRYVSERRRFLRSPEKSVD